MLRKNAVKHPLVFGTVIAITFWIVMFIASAFIGLFAPKFLVNNGEYLLQATVECFVALAGIGLMALFGYNHIWSEKKTGLFAGFGVGGYFIFVQIAALYTCLVDLLNRYEETGTLTMQPGWKIAVYFVCFFLVGFAEETFFRGLVANFFFDKHAKDPAGVWTATIWSGLVFGLMHLLNIVGMDAVGVIVQMVVVSAMGMAFTAVYYRTRNIWVVILLHAFNNICAGFSTGFFEGASLSDTISSYSPIECIGVIPYIIVTIILLRPKKLREIVQHENNADLSPEERITSYKKSKRSKAVAILVAVVILGSLFGASVALSGGLDLSSMFSLNGQALNYMVTEEWTGEDYFTDTVEFTVDDTAVYTLMVGSYPGDSKVYVTVTIADNDGEEVFTQSYGGRCTDEAEVLLEAGKTYTATVDYDFSGVTDGSEVHYITLVEIY